MARRQRNRARAARQRTQLGRLSQRRRSARSPLLGYIRSIIERWRRTSAVAGSTPLARRSAGRPRGGSGGAADAAAAAVARRGRRERRSGTTTGALGGGEAAGRAPSLLAHSLAQLGLTRRLALLALARQLVDLARRVLLRGHPLFLHRPSRAAA